MKRALIVRGGWDGHEPEQCADLAKSALEDSGFDVEVSGSLRSYTDETLMESVDLIVQVWTLGTISDPQLEGLLDAVASGVGFAGWHGGMCDSFRQNDKYHFLCGGQFVAHLGGLVEYDVNIVKTKDPIALGLGDFSLFSEQYYMQVDPSNEVLATTTFDAAYERVGHIHVVMPVIWKRKYGEGRVFYASFGHQARDFEVPEAKEIIKRGMLWAGTALAAGGQ